MSFSADYLLKHDGWEWQEHQANCPEVPVPLAIAGLLMHWRTAQALGWAEHTGDWDFYVQIEAHEDTWTHVWSGNPDLVLVYKGSPIDSEDLWKFFLEHNFNDLEVQSEEQNGLSMATRHWELRVDDWNEVGSQEDDPIKTYINLVHIAKIDIGWES